MAGFKEPWEGQPPNPDNMHYMSIDAANLNILEYCAVVCVADYGEYTEMVFQASDHITYYSLRIYCKKEFEIAKWTADPERYKYLIELKQ